MKIQIVYALVASEKDLFIEEVWCSIFSLRIYEPERKVIVCCDAKTAERIKHIPELEKLITELVVVQLPEDCNTPKLMSRQIKTTVRQHVEGSFLFVDTDTVFCGEIVGLDSMTCDIAAVREYHLPLAQSPFKESVISNMRKVFDVDVSSDDGWYNSGVMYVADNELTCEFYEKWNMYWRYSALEKKMSQDEPALMMTNIDFGYIIEDLPDVYNSQPTMSVKYFADAKIIHFLHMFFPKDQSYCQFIDRSFYKRMHEAGRITSELAEEIKNVKSSFASPSCVVGWQTMSFMTSPSFTIFEHIYNEGGAASWLMMKMAGLLEWLHKYSKKK